MKISVNPITDETEFYTDDWEFMYSSPSYGPETQTASDGGSGSGNFGHSGRPGKVGGSSENGGSKSVEEGKSNQKSEWFQKQEKRKEIASKWPANRQAEYCFENGFATEEEALKAMEDGTTQKLIDRYFNIMQKNGDPTPTKPIYRNNTNELHERVARGDNGGSFDECRKDIIMERTGCNEEEAKEYLSQFWTWTGGRWTSASTEVLDRYVDSDGVVDGEIYRGLSFDEEKYNAFMNGIEPGAVIGMKGYNSSWTTSREEAINFSRGGDRHVVIKCIKNKTSAPIAPFNHHGEDEVMAHSRAQWTVLGVIEGDRRTEITVIESEHRMSEEDRDKRRILNDSLNDDMSLEDRINEQAKYMSVVSRDSVAVDGGPGSGNHGHAGRPGQVGGSAPGEGGGGLGAPTKENKELSGMQVNIAKNIAKKAEKHPKVYDDWASSLTAEESRAIEDQFRETHKPDTNGYYSESVSEYYERIWKMLAANVKESKHSNKPVNGKDISMTYDWNRVSYTEPKFGQVIDTQIEDILEKQGFNGVPKIVSKEEMDKFIEEHPDSPIMYRTYTAPDQKTLKQYDADLDSGAWYVDCGTGGSKYGQGMYTAAALPWNPNDLDSAYDPDLFEHSPSFGRGKVVYDEKTGMYYQLGEWDICSKYKVMDFDDGDRAIVRDGESNFVVVIEKRGDKIVDTETGNELDWEYVDGFDEMIPVNVLPKEELSKRDINRPLGQMRDYIKLNTRREEKNVDKTEYYKELDYFQQQVDELSRISQNVFQNYRGDGNAPIMVDATKKGEIGRNYFRVGRMGEPLTRDSLDSIKEGDYLITFDDPMSRGAERQLKLVHSDGNGNISNISEYDSSPIESQIDRIVELNGRIHPCHDVTPKEPVQPDFSTKTSTRRMSLDPSANLITYESLYKKFAEYEDRYSVGRRVALAVNKVADERNFTREQRDALMTQVELSNKTLTKRDLETYYKTAEKLGGRKEADRLVQEYSKAFNEIKENQRLYLSGRIEDIGAYAAALGYDGILCSNYGRTIVVLNRTKLILSDERVEVPREEAS